MILIHWIPPNRTCICWVLEARLRKMQGFWILDFVLPSSLALNFRCRVPIFLNYTNSLFLCNCLAGYLPVCSCLVPPRWRVTSCGLVAMPRQRQRNHAVACAVVGGMAVWPGTGRGHGRDRGGWRFCWSLEPWTDDASPSRVSGHVYFQKFLRFSITLNV